MHNLNHVRDTGLSHFQIHEVEYFLQIVYATATNILQPEASLF